MKADKEGRAPIKVMIIGAGYAGTMVAVHLARETPAPGEITLVERANRFGVGIAYSTKNDAYLLNVPAGQMSALPGDDGHFTRWAQARDPSVHGGSFLRRRLYGEYITGVLEEARSQARAGVSLDCRRGEVVGMNFAPTGVEARMDDGSSIKADIAVLAVGNFPPEDPPCATPEFYSSPLYRRNPWAVGALKVDPDSDVLVLGSGLTMLDVVASLEQDGHRGTVWCMSRRGLLPQIHRQHSSAPPRMAPPPDIDEWPRTALGLLRKLRREVERNDRDWRDVVSSLRQVTSHLWQLLPAQEKRRFLHRLRPFWDTHRHRAAPEMGRMVERLRAEGRLQVIAGRVLRYDEANGSVHVTIRRGKSGTEQVFTVSRVLNCTGPCPDLSRVEDPLVKSLRETGVIRPDATKLGLDADSLGRALSREGVPNSALFIVGPLLKGRFWEHTAVPELRVGALQCARDVIVSALALGNASRRPRSQAA
jgi:uncharacterized NAD(P)/FAD-binding protein YdhS